MTENLPQICWAPASPSLSGAVFPAAFDPHKEHLQFLPPNSPSTAPSLPFLSSPFPLPISSHSLEPSPMLCMTMTVPQSSHSPNFLTLFVPFDSPRSVENMLWNSM